MCGRYAQSVRENGIEEVFDIRIGPSPEIIPSWNVAPTQAAPVVAVDASEARAIRLHCWGLVPSWADPAAAVRAINARAETVATLPTFRAAFAKRRCLVPATGFYEWQKRGTHKVPHLIHPTDQAVFAFAGLWEVKRTDAGDLRSFAVITTTPNVVAAAVHDRIPVILPRASWADWLDPEAPAAYLQQLLVPYPAALTEAYPVSMRVGSPSNNDPSLVERVTSVEAA